MLSDLSKVTQQKGLGAISNNGYMKHFKHHFLLIKNPISLKISACNLPCQ